MIHLTVPAMLHQISSRANGFRMNSGRNSTFLLRLRCYSYRQPLARRPPGHLAARQQLQLKSSTSVSPTPNSLPGSSEEKTEEPRSCSIKYHLRRNTPQIQDVSCWSVCIILF